MYGSSFAQTLSAVLLVLIAAPAWAGPSQDQYALGANHYAHQRWRLAVEELELYLKRWPEASEADTARFLIAESLVQMGRYDEARGRFSQFLDRAPKHRYARQALFRLGETAYLTRRLPEARRRLEQFRRKYPDDRLCAYALPYLGEIALADSDADQAETLYAESLRKFPEGPLASESRFGMARALQLQGDWRAAQRFYHFLADSPKEPLADHAQLQMGVMFYELERYEQAAAALEALPKQFPDSPLRTDAQYWLGMTRIAQQQWSQAARILDAARPDETDHPLAPAIVFWSAEARRHDGDLREAVQRYEQVVQDWPRSPWADDSLHAEIQIAFEREQYSLLDGLADQFDQRFPDSDLREAVRRIRGRALLKQDQYGSAADTFTALVQTSDGDENSHQADRRTDWYYLALARLGQQQYQAALEALEQAAPADDQPELLDGVRVARASALVGLKRYDEAVAPLKAYLASQPEGPDAPKCRAQLIVALARLGRLDDADGVYEKLHDSDLASPFLPPATLCFAQAAYAAGDWDRSGRLFRDLARDGNPPEYAAKGLSGWAWSQYMAKNAEAAAKTFRNLVRQYPDSPLAPEAAYMRAEAWAQLQRPEKALTAYLAVPEQYPQSKQAPAALFQAAQLCDRLGRDEKAAELFGRLIAEHPEFPRIDAALYQQAWALADLGRPEAADEAFRKLAADHRDSPYWADAVYRLAERAEQAGNHDEAIRRAEQIIQSDCSPEVLTHALYLQGEAAAAAQQWPRVESAMRRIVDQAPQSPLRFPAEYWLAESLYRQGEYEAAAEHLEKLAGQADQRSDQWLGMIPLRRAQILAHQKQWQAAYELAQTVARQYPDFRQQYEVDYLLGRCLASQGKYREARAAYERVLQSPIGGKTETAAMAQWMIGESYFHQQRYDEAIKAYHRVESLFAYPRWQAAALLQAGKCREIKSQWEEAARLYSQVLQEYPETTFTDEAAERLQVARQRASQRSAL